MKRVEAILRHFKLEDVKNSLVEAGIHGMTVLDCRGFGNQKGHTEIYRGTEYAIDFVPKLMIFVIVPDESVETVIRLIIDAAKTSQIGDGKIIVSDIIEVIRIRTEERGHSAL